MKTFVDMHGLEIFILGAPLLRKVLKDVLHQNKGTPKTEKHRDKKFNMGVRQRDILRREMKECHTMTAYSSWSSTRPQETESSRKKRAPDVCKYKE